MSLASPGSQQLVSTHVQRDELAKATDDEIASGILADTRGEYDKLKSTAPIFGGGDEGRKARAAFVDKHGLDAYINRNKVEPT